MSRLSSFFLGVVVGAAGLYVSTHYYVVRTNDGVQMVPKLVSKIEIPYVDVRNYRYEDWQQNQPLAMAMIKAKKGDVFKDSAMAGFQETLEASLQQFTGE